MGVTLDLTFSHCSGARPRDAGEQRAGPAAESGDTLGDTRYRVRGSDTILSTAYLNLLLELVPDREPAAVPEVE